MKGKPKYKGDWSEAVYGVNMKPCRYRIKMKVSKEKNRNNRKRSNVEEEL